MSPETRLNLYYQIKLRVYIIIIVHLHTHAYSLVPRPFPPPVFHRFQYESDEILAVGTAWERGYTCTLTPSPHAPRRLDNGVVYALFSHQVSYSDELASTRGSQVLHVVERKGRADQWWWAEKGRERLHPVHPSWNKRETHSYTLV